MTISPTSTFVVHIVFTPISTEQPLSRVLNNMRSARTSHVVFSQPIFESTFETLLSPFLISTPKAPCPTACSIPLSCSDGWDWIRSAKRSLRRPAAARSSALYSEPGSSSFARRDSMFPQMSAHRRCGYDLFSCADRLRLDVPTTEPLGRSDNDRSLSPSASDAFNTTQSLGSRRFVTHPRSKPAGKCVGMSLRL